MIAPARFAYHILLGTAVLVQFTLVSITFPLKEVLSETPIFHNDGAYHWYQIKTALNLAKTDHIVGYDPFFAAGHVGGIPLNASGKLPAVLSFLLDSWFSDVVAYKFFVFLSGVLCVICAPLACQVLRLRLATALIATLLGFFLWWASAFHWYFTAGMTSFVLAAYLALPYLAIIFHYFKGGSWNALFVLALLGALGLLLHPLFPIPVAVGTLSYLLVQRRDIDLKRVLILGFVLPLLCLMPNLFWVAEMFGNERIAGPYQQIVDVNLIWQEMLGQWK